MMAVLIAVIATIGVVGAFGFGGGLGLLNGKAHIMAYGNVSYNASYNGISEHTFNHANHNPSNTIKRAGAVVQCDTTYANGVSNVLSSKFGTNLSTSQVDQANANVQSNVTSNATGWNTRMSFALYANAFENFLLHYRLAVHPFNSTMRSDLKTDLSTTDNSLSSCMATNSTGHMRYYLTMPPVVGHAYGLWQQGQDN